MNINKDKLYLLIKIIRELAKVKGKTQRHNLKTKAEILNQLFSNGMDNTLKYYKNRLEVIKNGNKQPGVEEN